MNKTSKAAIARKLNQTPIRNYYTLNQWGNEITIEAIKDFSMFRLIRPFVEHELRASGYETETTLDGLFITIKGRNA